MKKFDPVWNEIYERGEQLNLYPYSSIVSFLFSYGKKLDREVPVKVLEIGCGSGNNLWCAAREGFEVTGLDASEHAINFASKRFQDEGLSGSFLVGDFSELPFNSETFDIVIERAALSQSPKPIAELAVKEVKRVLTKDGLFHAEIYSDRATTRGKTLAGGMIKTEHGPYAGVGQMSLYSKNELYNLFDSNFILEEVLHTESFDVTQKPYEVFARWQIRARKTDHPS